MLSDLIDDAIKARNGGDGEGLERALKNLQSVGVDRWTALVMMQAREDDLRMQKKLQNGGTK